MTIYCTDAQYRRNLFVLAALWGDRGDDWGVWEARSYCLLYMDGSVTY